MRRNTGTALAIALFAASALCAVVSVALTPSVYRGGNSYSALINSVENYFAWGFIPALALLIVIGPVWFLIYRLFRLSGLAWHFTLGGIIGATVGAFAELTISADDQDCWQTHDETLPLLQFGAYGAIFGIVGGAILWLIRRPDRDTSANPASTAP